MVLAHDTEMALGFAAALANSGPPTRPETLTSLAALRVLYDAWEWTGTPPRTMAELEATAALRARIRAVWQADTPEQVREVNALLREFGALPQLVIHEPFGWHIHATADDESLAKRSAVEFAMAMVDVIRSGDADRLRTCEGAECSDLFVDLSRNRSRRYCDQTCANKVHVAAYRRRQRTP